QRHHVLDDGHLELFGGDALHWEGQQATALGALWRDGIGVVDEQPARPEYLAIDLERLLVEAQQHIGLVATAIEPVRAQPNLEERHPTLDLRRWAEVGQHLEAGSCGRLDQQLARLLNPFARFARHTQDERATLCLCTGGAVRLGRLPRLRHRSTCLPPNPANPEPRWNPPPGRSGSRAFPAWLR